MKGTKKGVQPILAIKYWGNLGEEVGKKRLQIVCQGRLDLKEDNKE